jgi:hypothetical protein
MLQGGRSRVEDLMNSLDFINLLNLSGRSKLWRSLKP